MSSRRPRSLPIIPCFALVIAAACNSTDEPSGPDAAGQLTPSEPPKIHIHDGAYLTDFDAGYCRGSMLPIQDPVFPTIRRDRFEIDSTTDIVTIPADWIAETRTRAPELRAAADERLPRLLGKVEDVVGREFDQRDFDYFFYLCPYFEGGTASAKVYPMFMYLHAAVGDLAWPDWLFTDQYLFHEVLHNFVMERVDYRTGTPFLNDLYAKLVVDEEFTAAWMAYLGNTGAEPKEELAADQAQMVGLVLSHVHLYAIMSEVLRDLDEDERLETIHTFETSLPSSHPSYVEAWRVVMTSDPAALAALLAEVR